MTSTVAFIILISMSLLVLAVTEIYIYIVTRKNRGGW